MELRVFSLDEFDNSADNVACDELSELRAMIGELMVSSSDVMNALVMVAVFATFPLASTSRTVVGCWFARIDDRTDDSEAAAFDNCGFYAKSTLNLIGLNYNFTQNCSVAFFTRIGFIVCMVLMVVGLAADSSVESVTFGCIVLWPNLYRSHFSLMNFRIFCNMNSGILKPSSSIGFG